ncbi:MAG: ATP-NAD kinase-like domain-containing protein [Monoraphidium minutum]|nr:MAG: ATP-NAD kinase-like domain-containing protein [Monoraphidium minutum]
MATHRSASSSIRPRAMTQPDVSAAAPSAPAVSRGARRHLLLLLHGARIYDPLVREAIEGLKEDGHEVTVRVTWDSGDVERFVHEAALLDGAARFDTIVAGGGDGTLNELVAALLRPPGDALLRGGATSVAQLPLGTANDLASASGISLDPREALALAVDPAAARPVDVALVNGEVFLNLATVGPVSEVSSKGMSDAAKKALGPAAILVSSIRQLFVTGLQPTQDVTITYPLNPTARPPPPPEPQPCTPGLPCPPTKVLAGAGLAAPSALAGAPSGGDLPGAAGAAAPKAPATPEAPAAAAARRGGRQAAAPAGAEAEGGVAAAEAGEPPADESRPATVAAARPPEIEPAPPAPAAAAAAAQEGMDAGGSVSSEGVDLAAAGVGAAAEATGLGRLRGDLLALVAGQSRQMGRMINVCPSALLDDGMLDFTIMFGTPGQQLGRAGVGKLRGGMQIDGWERRGGASAPHACSGAEDAREIGRRPAQPLTAARPMCTPTHSTPPPRCTRPQAARLAADVAARGLGGAQGGILLARCPWLLVEAGERLKTNRDGEPTLEARRLLFEVLPRAIRLHLPDDRLLLGGLPPPARAAAAAIAAPTRGRRRRGVLRDLLRAQQPPGRFGRRLAALKRGAGRAAWSAAVFGVGYFAGLYQARGGLWW